VDVDGEGRELVLRGVDPGVRAVVLIALAADGLPGVYRYSGALLGGRAGHLLDLGRPRRGVGRPRGRAVPGEAHTAAALRLGTAQRQQPGEGKERGSRGRASHRLSSMARLLRAGSAGAYSGPHPRAYGAAPLREWRGVERGSAACLMPPSPFMERGA